MRKTIMIFRIQIKKLQLKNNNKMIFHNKILILLKINQNINKIFPLVLLMICYKIKEIKIIKNIINY